MRTPISTDKAASLLEHMVKQQMSSDTSQIADQMRHDGWEESLSDGETLTLLAGRALAYLATHEGIALFNFFVKTFARTSGTMFGQAFVHTEVGFACESRFAVSYSGR